MMAVEISANKQDLFLGKPEALFDTESSCSSGPVRSYDVSKDGQRFLLIRQNRSEALAKEREWFGKRVSVVLNWSEELRRLAPTE